MRARSTRLDGSVRDRAKVSSTAKSSGPIDNSIKRRGAAMISSRQIDDLINYILRRDRGNPPQAVAFSESMYSHVRRFKLQARKFADCFSSRFSMAAAGQGRRHDHETTVDHALMRGLVTAGPVMRRGASSV